MERKTIKYIGFYDFPDKRKTKRVSCLAATNKMDYVCSAIVRAGYDVRIVSPSFISHKGRGGFEKQRTVRIDDHVSITSCPSCRTSSKVAGHMKIVFSYGWLFFYLLFKTQKAEKILVYHSPWLSVPIRMAKLFKRFKLILEVEEIYSDVWEKEYKHFSVMEKKLLESADNYILVSNLLAKTLGISNAIILYGSYDYKIKTVQQKNRNGYINVVYTGSIDTLRSAAFKLVGTANYLDKKYKIHITGFGPKKQIEKLEQQILSMNYKIKRQACIYHGVKNKIDFEQFLFSCQIGVNSQKEGDYFNTAFPSKILTYLSHNLRVVSTPVKSVVESGFSDMIIFAESDSPQDIAKAIMSIDLNQPYDSRARIKELDEKFVNDIGKLLARRTGK